MKNEGIPLRNVEVKNTGLEKAMEKISKNLDGMISPGLFIALNNTEDIDKPFNLSEAEQDDFINSIFEIVGKQGGHINNPYHNPTHFREVYDRAVQLVTEAETPEDKFAVRFASVWHDYDHPGKGVGGVMTLKEISGLYGGEVSEDQLRGAINSMIVRDNVLLEAQNASLPIDDKRRKPERALVSETGEIKLTPEEVSALYADASLVEYGRKTGKEIPLAVRARVNSLIKSTDFGNTRNYPKTGMEWQFKFADMANFLKPIDSWLATAVNVGLEAPWGPPANLLKFVNGEIFFLKVLVKEPILDNSVSGKLFAPEVSGAVADKIAYLEKLKTEIEQMQGGSRMVEDIGPELANLKEITKPLFNGSEPPIF